MREFQCKACGQTKSAVEFYLRGSGSYQDVCIECDKERSVRYQIRKRIRSLGTDYARARIAQLEKELNRWRELLAEMDNPRRHH
jgi:hypothetical protein